VVQNHVTVSPTFIWSVAGCHTKVALELEPDSIMVVFILVADAAATKANTTANRVKDNMFVLMMFRGMKQI